MRKQHNCERSRHVGTATYSRSLASSAKQSWYEEFGLVPRFPRPPIQKIHRLVSNIQEPQILLRPRGTDKTDIIIRLHVGSCVVPQQTQKQFARFGLTIKKAFEDILWQKLEAGRITTWVELTGLGAKVYRQAWLQWFRLQYLGHVHPVAESSFKTIEREIESASKVSHRGRHPAIQAELASLRKRYRQLLPKCRLIHRAATRAAKSLAANNVEVTRKKMRQAIWGAVRHDVHGMPGDGYVFGGEAFKRIPYGNATLHDPTSWRPHQLAISLVSFERSQAYQTIEKKVIPTKFGS
jgi:hypothetical protein